MIVHPKTGLPASQTLTSIEFIVRAIQYKDWRFHLTTDEDRPYLQVQFSAPDCQDGASKPWHGRKWALSYYMTRSEIVTTALKAVLTAVEHEAREAFTYGGHAIFGPHISVEKLWELCDRGAGSLDVRS